MHTVLIPRQNLDFMLLWLEPKLDGDELATTSAVLDVAEELAADAFLSHYKQADQSEPRLERDGVHVLPAIGAALRKYAELGFFAAGFERPLGGMGLSTLVSSAIFTQFAAANIATSAYPMLTAANARLIARFGSAEQIEQFALPQIGGRWFGTMCLSEPQAGSSLADIRMRACPEGTDSLGERYLLTGNKMWISGGDQDISENIVHLVLAKIPRADGTLAQGTKDISLFVVPKILPSGRRNDIAVAGLNHKMGYRGTVNCLLNFGETKGAVGWLIGNAGDGLQQMFHMMNEARIAVGLGAAALGYRGYMHALHYARERRQGRLTGVRAGPPVAIIEHVDVKRMLLAQKTYAEGSLALCLFCAHLVDRADDERAATLLGLLTPVAKTWSSEYGLVANDLAIQIHGGYGYTRDFDVEQLYRDNRLNPIHEGTTGIQALDLLGRKILRGGGAPLETVTARIKSCCDRARSHPALEPYTHALSAAWRTIITTVDALRSIDAVRALDNATPFLSAFGHTIVAWLWLEQATAADQAASTGRVTRSFAQGKQRACRYFFECELPRVYVWLKAVTSCSDVAAGASLDEF